jgi:hypothetical protein
MGKDGTFRHPQGRAKIGGHQNRPSSVATEKFGSRFHGSRKRELCEHASFSPRFFGIFAERLVGVEEQVALNGKIEVAAHFRKLGNRDISEFRAAHSEIAKPEGDVRFVGIDFG